MQVQLYVQMQGAEYPWNYTGNAFRAGRSMDCELSLSGPDSSVVSGHHVRLEFSAQGLTVWDLRSKNGTFVNGRRIEAPQPVHVGDEINLGMNGPKLKIVDIDHPAAHRTAATVPHGAGHAGAYAPQPPAPIAPAPFQHNAGVQTPVFGAPNQQHYATATPTPSSGPTPTRMLLLGVMARQRRLWAVIVCLVLLLVCAAGATFYFVWHQPDEPETNNPSVSNTDVYKKALLSACWIRHAVRDENGFERETNGSGCVFDRKRRLIITNYHVVDGLTDVEVYFPAYRDDKVITSGKHYIFEKLAKKGTVLKREKSLDLAVVQVDALPDETKAVPFADRSPEQGTPVHMVGGKPVGAGNEVFGYGRGLVRGNSRGTYNIVDGTTQQVILTIDGRVIRSNMPSNPGDSGAGVVNDEGYLVGVNNANAEGVGNSLHVDISEVKRFLRNNDYYD